MDPAAHIILERGRAVDAVRTGPGRAGPRREVASSPGFRAKAVPGQLQQLEAQAQKNRVLVADGPHEDAKKQSLTGRGVLQGSHDTPGAGAARFCT